MGVIRKPGSATPPVAPAAEPATPTATLQSPAAVNQQPEVPPRKFTRSSHLGQTPAQDHATAPRVLNAQQIRSLEKALTPRVTKTITWFVWFAYAAEKDVR